MAGIVLVVLICIGFYLFVGFAPQQAIQIMLTLVWGLMLLSAIISPFF